MIEATGIFLERLNIISPELERILVIVDNSLGSRKITFGCDKKLSERLLPGDKIKFKFQLKGRIDKITEKHHNALHIKELEII